MPISRSGGLDDLRRKLKELERTKKVAFSELFPSTFLRKYTRFQSLTDMQKKAEAEGFSFRTEQEVEAIPSPEWEAFIKGHTRFRSWQEMLQTAGDEYAARKLGLGK
jgi:hypothetical protein